MRVSNIATGLKNCFNNQKVFRNAMVAKAGETGRGMIEMLGVLAIIGVLSVIALYGYRLAMERYVANKIVNEMNLISNQVMVVMERMQDADSKPVLGVPYDKGKLTQTGCSFHYGCGEMGKGAAISCKESKGIFFVGVNDVPYGICKHVITLLEYLKLTAGVEVNGVIKAKCSEKAIDGTALLNDITWYGDIEDMTTFFSEAANAGGVAP